jgi:hypothetical protein
MKIHIEHITRVILFGFFDSFFYRKIHVMILLLFGHKNSSSDDKAIEIQGNWAMAEIVSTPFICILTLPLICRYIEVREGRSPAHELYGLLLPIDSEALLVKRSGVEGITPSLSSSCPMMLAWAF